MTDPLTGIMAPSCSEHPECPPIFREVGMDLGFWPDIKLLTIERVARIFDVPPELLEAPTEAHYGRWLHPDELPIKARRPWVAAEQLDATQQFPVIAVDSP